MSKYRRLRMREAEERRKIRRAENRRIREAEEEARYRSEERRRAEVRRTAAMKWCLVAATLGALVGGIYLASQYAW